MNLKLRLIILQFLQYFILGSWLLTIGAYWFQNRPPIVRQFRGVGGGGGGADITDVALFKTMT